jgi:integrase
MRLIPALTVARIKSALQNPKPTELRDGLVRGLCLRTGPRGARWSLQITLAGINRRFALGPYPFISLQDARKRATDKRNELATTYIANSYPSQPATLLELLNAYHNSDGKHLRSWQSNEAQKRIKHVLQPHIALPLQKLDARALQRTIDAHPSPNTAANCVRYVRPVLKWARRRGYSHIIAADLEQPRHTAKERDRVLSEQELRQILNALTFEGYDLAARLLLLTAVRLNELRQVHRREIDPQTKIWTIPADRMKAKRPHSLPLSEQAYWMFEQAFEHSPTPFTSLVNWDRWQKKIFLRTNTTGWHRHDLRRTAATILGERLEVEPYVVDALLAHAHLTGNKVARTYNRARYLPQIALALQNLADYYKTLADVTFL